HAWARLHGGRTARRAGPGLQAALLARIGEAADPRPAPRHGQPRVHAPLRMRRKAWLALLFGALGLAVTVWLLGGNLASLGRLPRWAYVAGTVLVAVNYLASAARLKLLAERGGHDLPLTACLRAYALGLFSGAVTPGSAGQLPAMALALRRDGLPGG